MRIGHILPTGVSVTHTRGGALQRRVRELSSVQVAAGHDVYAFSPRDSDPHRILEGGLQILPVPLRLQRPLADYEYLAKVTALVRGLELDVLHAHGAPEAARWLSGSARIVVHTVDFFRYRLTNRRLGRYYFRGSLNKFDAILPVSNYSAAGLKAHYGSLTSDVRVVPNGVNLSQFTNEPSRRELSQTRLRLPRGRFVLYLGRIAEQKGSDMLPGLARRLALSGISLVVAGPVEQFGSSGRSQLLDRIQESGAEYLGAVSDELLPGLLASADLLVLPTRRDEMFGMVLIEAGAAGTPAVASDLGGIPEALGEGGRLFPVGDQAALERSVLGLVESPGLLAELSARAVDNAQRFSWPIVAGQYEDIYREHLARRPRG